MGTGPKPRRPKGSSSSINNTDTSTFRQVMGMRQFSIQKNTGSFSNINSTAVTSDSGLMSELAVTGDFTCDGIFRAKTYTCDNIVSTVSGQLEPPGVEGELRFNKDNIYICSDESTNTWNTITVNSLSDISESSKAIQGYLDEVKDSNQILLSVNTFFENIFGNNILNTAGSESSIETLLTELNTLKGDSATRVVDLTKVNSKADTLFTNLGDKITEANDAINTISSLVGNIQTNIETTILTNLSSSIYDVSFRNITAKVAEFGEVRIVDNNQVTTTLTAERADIETINAKNFNITGNITSGNNIKQTYETTNSVTIQDINKIGPGVNIVTLNDGATNNSTNYILMSKPSNRGELVQIYSQCDYTLQLPTISNTTVTLNGHNQDIDVNNGSVIIGISTSEYNWDFYIDGVKSPITSG